MRILNHWARWCMAAFTSAALIGCVPTSEDNNIDTKQKSDSSYIVAENAIPGEYIVVFDSQELGLQSVNIMSQQMADNYSAEVRRTFSSALNGFVAEMSEEDARAMANDPSVAWVEENAIINLNETQNGATWGLDRIDQANLPLDRSFEYPDSAGEGVHVYVIDTGVRVSHNEFRGRIGEGFDAIDNDGNPDDCQGHGTHVAGTAAGATYGVAKSATVHGVRVLDCRGSGTTAGVIAGVDWVTSNHEEPAVANMSLGGGASSSLDQAVRNSIRAGVTYALAAGNENQNACNVSPARTEEAITVGSTTRSDARSSFSNFGTCVDLFAPGSSITAAWIGSDSDTNTISGTSMASPHVAGAAALFLGENPNASPAQVRDALVGNGSNGQLSSIGSGSPNVLLNIGFINGVTPPNPDPDPDPDPDPTPPEGDRLPYTASNTNSALQNTVNAQIALSAGDTLTIGTCGVDGADLNGDTYLRLFFQGGQVANNDDSCGGRGSRINFTAQEDGVYEIRAGCYSNRSCGGTVAWAIEGGSTPPPPPPAPSPGSEFDFEAGNTNNASRNTVNQTITLQEGQRVTFGTCGMDGAAFDGDTYLRAYRGNTQVARNDDACNGRGSRLSFTAQVAGEYELRAGCYSNQSCGGTAVWTIE